MSSTFFGIQVALKLSNSDPLRKELSEAVLEHSKASSIMDQRLLWSKIGRKLANASDAIEYGCWDLVTKKAPEEYEDWASTLEAMAAWPEEHFGVEGDHLLVSVIALVIKGSNADQTLGTLCDIPKSKWHSLLAYKKLLGAMPQLNFFSVIGNGLYVAPRPDSPGFSMDVLSGEGFEHLKKRTWSRDYSA